MYTVDRGGSVRIHVFGAVFGVAARVALTFRGPSPPAHPPSSKGNQGNVKERGEETGVHPSHRAPPRCQRLLHAIPLLAGAAATSDTRHSSNRGHELQGPFSRTDRNQRFFPHKYSRLWNTMAQQTSLHNLSSLQAFKAAVHRWSQSACEECSVSSVYKVMASNNGSGGPGDSAQGQNPFKLTTSPPASVSLVFSSGGEYLQMARSQAPSQSNYMLFGGMTNTSPTASPSSASRCNFFGMTSTSPSSAVAGIPNSTLFGGMTSLGEHRYMTSSSLGSGGSRMSSVMSSTIQPASSVLSKPQSDTKAISSSSTPPGIPSGNIFGGLTSSASGQTTSLFSAVNPSDGEMLGSGKNTFSLLSAKIAPRDTATSTSPNAFPLPFSGTGEIKPPSLFSTVKTDSMSTKDFSKDTRPAPTPLLSRGVTNTSQSQPSAARNVFAAPPTSKLFEGQKNTSSLPNEIDKISQYDKKELTKIIIAQIPDSCMDREILKNHFVKFGNVKRVTLNPRTNQATVQYEDHRSASRAKKKGKKIHPNLPEVRIFYGTPARRKSEDGNADAMMSKKKAIRTLQSAHSPSDIDPYEPLPRPSEKETVELPKPIQARVSQPKPAHARSSQPKPTHARSSQPKPTHAVSSQPTQREKAPEKVKKGKPKQGAGAKEMKEPSVAVEGKEPEEVIQSKCNTSHDKYNVLKARDCLVRKEIIRTSDIKKASYLSATCPDMCPESERYMRDVQNDLSSYEMTNGVMDHRLVVKKFSRSSADKDEPLPYELRPGPVLLKTMDFLVCNIIERGEDEDVETDVWYNYLWNRTRAIRNDLMQQQLTDGKAVAIIERCMRFHIHAAARFCQEPPDLFDAKMNTEHLTKSLQTLKELYQDLGEIGEYFETEPEFRAYELLLNLNEGQTFITQYSQYREEVQKSKEVQFALKVGMALMFNNYVKFFKLMKSATYLQACVMHRYFRQVRLKALDTLMKAYVPPKQVQTLPLETVITILGFENEADAESYLQVYGIKVADKNVILDRSLFSIHVEEQPPLVRPLKMVESNRTSSVGEVIQGGPLPENPLLTHVPHDSFDSQGYLKKEAYNASDQQVGKQVPAVEIREPPVQQTQQWTTSELMACMNDIYMTTSSSVIKEMLFKITKEAKEECHLESINKVAQIAGKEILTECLKEEIHLICERALQGVQYEEEVRRRRLLEEEERKRKAMQELLEKVAKVLCAEYVEEFVEEFVRNLCTKAVQEVEKETWEVVIAELIVEMPQTLCREVMLSEVKKLSAEVITAMKDELEAKITRLQQKISMRKMRDSFKRWRCQVLRVKRRKQAQETFPASCSQWPINQQNELFGWGYHRSRQENMSAFQVSSKETTVAKNIEQMTLRNHLIRACAWHHLPLQQEMKKVVDGTLQPINLIKQYFKLPWTELIYACISHKLTGLPDLTVYHQPDKLNAFKYPPSWWAACDASDLSWATTRNENLPPTSRKRKHGQVPEERTGQKKKPSKLLIDIEKEKRKYVEFEKRLEDMFEIEEELRNLLDKS
ncbi:hypothetical protein C7M84_016643 [Penaeus vannamei]|uniref:Germinal-center associated nuclear protein n=1 Tax=Penaeus vannamei TaxID=6689 RepID=A0A3R7LVA1_PENVA|nr:hypothetical protein C7M84_016643 [Penaeus vannamei]